MKQESFYYQQGDVLITSIKEGSFPEDAVKLSDTNVLQEGEHTGHAHRLDDDESIEIYESKSTKKKFLRVLKPVGLLHEEHRKQTIAPGDYSISIVKEFDHFSQMVRKVVD